MTNYEKIKIGIKAAKALGLLLAAIGVFIYAGSYADSIVTASPSISVTGVGKVVAKPDVARFTLAVQTEGGKDVASLRKTNDDTSNKIIDFLKAQGVPKEDIKTINYSMRPRYQNYNCRNVGLPTPIVDSAVSAVSYAPTQVCPPSEVVGYTFNNTIEVTIRDFEKKDLSGLLAGVVKNGATNVSQLNFELDDPTAARSLAKAEAIKKAQTEARRLAREGNISLGRILSIEEYGSPIYYSGMSVMGKGGAEPMAVDTAPAIEPGSQDISVTVNVRYALK